MAKKKAKEAAREPDLSARWLLVGKKDEREVIRDDDANAWPHSYHPVCERVSTPEDGWMLAAAPEMYAALVIALDFIGDFESGDRARNAARGIIKDAMTRAWKP